MIPAAAIADRIAAPTLAVLLAAHLLFFVGLMLVVALAAAG